MALINGACDTQYLRGGEVVWQRGNRGGDVDAPRLSLCAALTYGVFTSPAPNTLLMRNTPGDRDQSIPGSLALRPGYPAPVVPRLWSFRK